MEQSQKALNSVRLDSHTARGWLTAYALACGYVERAVKRNTTLQLWCEHGVYHVRAHDHGSLGRLFWHSYPTVKQARARFSESRRALGLTRL